MEYRLEVRAGDNGADGVRQSSKAGNKSGNGQRKLSHICKEEDQEGGLHGRHDRETDL